MTQREKRGPFIDLISLQETFFNESILPEQSALEFTKRAASAGDIPSVIHNTLQIFTGNTTDGYSLTMEYERKFTSTDSVLFAECVHRYNWQYSFMVALGRQGKILPTLVPYLCLPVICDTMVEQYIEFEDLNEWGNFFGVSDVGMQDGLIRCIESGLIAVVNKVYTFTLPIKASNTFWEVV